MLKMFRLQLVKNKLCVIACGLALVTVASGCSNAGSASSGISDNSQNTGTAITIDNAGVIPVFGTMPTTTVIYVHNNSVVTISGVNYGVVDNDHQNSSSLVQNNYARVDGSQCVAIAAGQSCALKITTPQFSEQSSQGSMLLQASYSLNNKAVSFNQIINYAQVQNNLVTAGAKFKAGIDISGYGNPTGYATIYLYGSGQNQVYNVSSMTINKPAVTIVNGNISGHQIQSNFVQAVEVSSPILSSSISATITVNSSTFQANNTPVNNSTKSPNKSLNASKSLLTSDQFSNSVDLAVEPVAAGAILTTGLIPLLNTVNGTSGSLLVQNSGNQNAVLGSASADAGISNLSGCSGETLAPAASCTISFNVTESGGSGNITIPYTGGSTSSIAANVTWFNGVGAALVSMSASNNPVTFSATVGGSTTITVQNIGGYTLRNISVPAPVVVGGSATATLANNNCAESVTLPVGSSCSYDVEVADSATDLNQQINLGFSASYAGPSGTQAYSRVMPLAYSSTAIPKYVYITNSGNNPSTISMYSINSGVLVPFSPESTATAGSFSGSISFTPSAANAYVVNLFGRNVSMFSVSNGLFTPLSPQSTVATQLAPGGIVINQAGTYAYVNNRSSASNSISIYSINAGGILTPLSPESTAPTQAGPMQVTFNKAGTYAYVVNQTSRTILMYSVDPSGMLTPFTPESTVNTQNTPSLLTFNSAETYAYLTNLNSNSISMYSVNSNGLLTPLSPESTVATESTPASFVLDSSNTHAYVVNGNSQSVSMYDIINGVLVPMSPESTVATQNTPNTITFDESGKYAYVINQISSTISMYNVNSSGVLMPISPESTVPTQGSPSGPMLIDPSNSFAYVANSSSNTISMYRILDGVLIPLSPESTVATQTGAVGLTFGPY
ncbi:MAG: beta-propeller fold lactonase family protein [Burkholderiales bacterium]|nr:beta-propeller fold lactonase family protein [Burkholderiales bacterium]MBP9767932.1 beta-propeller fold lactonase family protein [Burkholderiales bacterium]